MKKLLKRLLLLTMAIMMAFSFTACKPNNPDNPDNPNNPNNPDNPIEPGITTDKPVNTVTEPEEHLVTNGLHDVKVTDSDRKFRENGETQYKIVFTDNSYNRKAASFMQQHISKALGVSVKLEVAAEDTTYVADSKVIVLNVPAMFNAAGLTMPSVDLGSNGYYIKNVGNTYFIATQGQTGIQSGAISFLRHLIGYEMYAADTVVYDRAEDTIPDMDITEKPDFDLHVQGNRVTSEAMYGMGFQSSGDIFISVEGETWHNSLNFLPKETYQAKHPKWYSTKGNEICYTAQGDADELEEMTTTVADKMVQYANEYPDKPSICLTIEDHADQCGCAACAASREAYNGTDSAATIKFMNKVNRKVQAKLLEQAGGVEANKRKLNILFFAYTKMEKPPVVKDETTGKWKPIDDSVICDPEVGVYIAPIYAAYNQSFYHESNISAKNIIEGWGALSTKLYMWLYETNYRHYMYPINSYDTMIETYRFCKANNAEYIMNEGQYNQTNVTHFSKLKEYFNARAEFNVNDNYADIVNDFFHNYFGEAEVPMRKYFDELQAHLRYLEETFPADVNGNIYNPMEQTKLWSYGTLNGYLKLIDEAYAAIEPLKVSNPDRYKILEKHIKLESMFPRFALLRLYSGMYASTDLYNARMEFKGDCTTFGITYVQEQTSMETVFADWGL